MKHKRPGSQINPLLSLPLLLAAGLGACDKPTQQTANQSPSKQQPAASPSQKQTLSESQFDPQRSYSSVIIDARGLRVSASMSPFIQSAGRELFPVAGEKLETDFVINQGLSAYVYGSLEQARRSSRAGKQPLILRAQAAAGRAHQGLVLSESDGRNLLKADAKSGLLRQFKLVILLDP